MSGGHLCDPHNDCRKDLFEVYKVHVSLDLHGTTSFITEKDKQEIRPKFMDIGMFIQFM